MGNAEPLDRELNLRYRKEIEGSALRDGIQTAARLFIILQSALFIPADWILHPDYFSQFLAARLLENGLLAFVYFRLSRSNPLVATAFTAFTGSILFLYMVHLTGGVESGYYVGLMLLLVGMCVLAPLSGRQGAFISGVIFLLYASLPWTSHGGLNVNWAEYSQNLFFLGSACVEVALACTLMDGLRFRDFCQKRELIRARDELAEMDKAKTRFSANVHHELRTPLTLILSPLDALRSGTFGEVPGAISQTLDTMHSNGRRLHKMINNLLDLSKLESQQFKVVRRPTPIDKLVSELVVGAMPMADRKGVSIQHKGFDPEREIAIDPDAIEKVVINLIGNALKFTPSGGSIEIRTLEEDAGVSVSVQDSGIGIPPEQLDSIFDRFAQVDTSATRSFEGTGIGLSLAHEMVELHDGRIWAESDGPDKGTTMRVWLPNGMSDAAIEEEVLSDDSGRQLDAKASIEAIESDLNLEDTGEQDGPLAEIDRQIERATDLDPSAPQNNGVAHPESTAEILIAEDNPDMRRLLETLLGQKYRTRSARNGLEALEQIRASQPDLVLSDVMMPEMDGTELCRRIKQDPVTRSLPIVLVTSKAEDEMKVEGLELGADDYVTKPFHPRELLARVGSLVRSSVLRKELSQRNEQLGEALEELKRAEVLLVQNERLAAIGELAAGVAHEVNNPVNFALNAARMLTTNAEEIRSIVSEHPEGEASSPSLDAPKIEELGADVFELSTIVLEGLNRTQSLVGDLKRLASQDHGKGPPHREISLEAVLRSSLQLIGPTLREVNVGAEIEVRAEDTIAMGDEGALGQVFLNLLGNAADAMPPGGGEIRIEVDRIDGQLRIEVSDTGDGIDQHTQKQIFEPFFTTKPAGQGTGLGLAVSRQILTDHAGSISVSSEVGVGTSFEIVLPTIVQG